MSQQSCCRRVVGKKCSSWQEKARCRSENLWHRTVCSLNQPLNAEKLAGIGEMDAEASVYAVVIHDFLQHISRETGIAPICGGRHHVFYAATVIAQIIVCRNGKVDHYGFAQNSRPPPALL